MLLLLHPPTAAETIRCPNCVQEETAVLLLLLLLLLLFRVLLLPVLLLRVLLLLLLQLQEVCSQQSPSPLPQQRKQQGYARASLQLLLPLQLLLLLLLLLARPAHAAGPLAIRARALLSVQRQQRGITLIAAAPAEPPPRQVYEDASRAASEAISKTPPTVL